MLCSSSGFVLSILLSATSPLTLPQSGPQDVHETEGLKATAVPSHKSNEPNQSGKLNDSHEPLVASHVFVEANQAYDRGDYVQAQRLYERILAEHPSGRVHFNLGNTELRQGHLAKAVAAYLRAANDFPRDSDIQANLAFARKSTKDAMAPPSPSPVQQTLFFWHYSLTYHEVGWVFLIANALFWLLLIFLRFFQGTELLRWVAALMFAVMLATGSSFLLRAWKPKTIAVIAAHELDVRSGISQDATVLFKLHKGTEALVRDRQQHWVRIELSDKKQGWVKQEEIIEVEQQ